MKRPTSIYLDGFVHTRLSHFVESALGGRGTLNGFISFLEARAYELFHQPTKPEAPSRAWRRFQNDLVSDVMDSVSPATVRPKYFDTQYAHNFEAARGGLPWDATEPTWSHLWMLMLAADEGAAYQSVAQSRTPEPRLIFKSAVSFGAAGIDYWSVVREVQQLTTTNRAATQKRLLLDRGALVAKPDGEWDRPISLYINEDDHKFFLGVYGSDSLRALEDTLLNRFLACSDHNGYFRNLHAQRAFRDRLGNLLVFGCDLAQAEGVSWSAETIREVCESMLLEQHEQEQRSDRALYEHERQRGLIHPDTIFVASVLEMPGRLAELVLRCERNGATLPDAWVLAATADALDSGGSVTQRLEAWLLERYSVRLGDDPRQNLERVMEWHAPDQAPPVFSNAIEFHSCRLFEHYAHSLGLPAAWGVQHLALLGNAGHGSDPLGPQAFLALVSGLTVRVSSGGYHEFFKGKTRLETLSADEALRAAQVLGAALSPARLRNAEFTGPDGRLELGLKIIRRAARSQTLNVMDIPAVERAAAAIIVANPASLTSSTGHRTVREDTRDIDISTFQALELMPNLSVREEALNSITAFVESQASEALALFQGDGVVFVGVGTARSLKKLRPTMLANREGWRVDEVGADAIIQAIHGLVGDQVAWLETHPAWMQIDEHPPEFRFDDDGHVIDSEDF